MPRDQDWSTQAAMTIPRGYFEKQNGRYGPILPKNPACYGFSIIAKVIPGREDAMREPGKVLEAAVAADPTVLAVLKPHHLRRQVFPLGGDLYFQSRHFRHRFRQVHRGPVSLFSATGIDTVFTNREGSPEDGKTNPAALVEFVRDHHVPSFLEYGGYPYVSADEIKKALCLKDASSTMLDQMQ